jgi:putative endopeptidase
MLARVLPCLCLAAATAAASAAPAVESRGSGLDLAGFDRGQRPQDDLFRFTNGGWLAANPIPADRSRWGSLDQLADDASAQVRALLESRAPAGDAEAAAARAYYASFMDEARAEALGVRPLAAGLARIAGLGSAADVARYLGAAAASGVSVPLNLFISIDRGDPNAYAPYAWQGGLGMPDRDYYLKPDQFATVQGRYRAYLERLFSLAGLDRPAERAGHVYALEEALAAAQWSRVDNRDPVRTYNRITADGAAKLAPGIDWADLLEAAGLPSDGAFVLGQPGYATALAGLLAERPIKQWRDYLSARLIDSYAPYLSRDFVEAEFDFNSRTVRGTPQNRPRWKRAVSEVNRGMGFAVGREYVARHFPPQAKARMDALVGNLLAAMEEGIGELEWMSPPTRVAAREKLVRVRVKIGYPAVWRDYAGLEIRADDLVGNVMRATAFEWRRQAARLGGPVDRDEWLMAPQTVNAYYMPTANEIAFPAAILQPPFFNFEAEDAVNYGAIGAVIGHEISHGFDDQGSQFDPEGALRNWWTDADRQAFTQLGEALVAQYAQYEPLPGRKLNGRLTLGENIADLSGLQIAWKAWQKSLGGKPSPVIDGLTGAQRFFYGWSQAWREKVRESRVLQLLSTDPHAPASFRANGAVVNHDGFHRSFGTKPGDGMFKPEAERIRIW